MTLRDKFKKTNLGINLFSVFSIVVGGAEIFLLYLSGFRLFTLGILSLLSLVSAYGLIRMKIWSVWLVIVRLLLEMTFIVTTLYASIRIQSFYPNLGVLSFHIILITYLITTGISTTYVLAKKEHFH